MAELSDLQVEYQSLAFKYVKAFNKFLDEEQIATNGYWVGNEIGGVYDFGDYFVGYNDIRYVIDNSIKFEVFDDWYEYCVKVGLISDKIKCPTLDEWVNGDHGMSYDKLKTLTIERQRLQQHIEEFQTMVRDLSESGVRFYLEETK